MRAVLQRVTEASVRVDGDVVGSIGKGFFILLGVSDEDNEAVADKLADKICKLRIPYNIAGFTTIHYGFHVIREDCFRYTAEILKRIHHTALQTAQIASAGKLNILYSGGT